MGVSRRGSFTTTACVVGCGPAGAMLGLLLARAGVEVTVLEKHNDFLRDFRGDTVHPSTIEVLAELGLAERFLALPHRKVSSIGFVQGGRRVAVADFAGLGLRFPYIAFVPQGDFLDLLTNEARRYPTFRLLMPAEGYDVLREGERIAGVRYRDGGGEHELRAHFTVATDGRHSSIRRAVGLRPHEFGAPMDVLQFRLSRREGDPDDGYFIHLERGQIIVVLNRGTYWNIAYVFRKGGYEVLRRTGIRGMREAVARLVPFLAARVDELTGFDDTRFLEVRLNRLRRWHLPGLLLIGDAAHAMSPIGGVGVNLAVQDAVAAANLLAEPLLRAQHLGEPVPASAAAAVQRRRWLPTVATQTGQRLAQHFGVERSLRGRATPRIALVTEVPLLAQQLRRLMGRAIGVGLRPEHVRLPTAAA
ncbi:MAG TPA: FAD-dependent oxidoreductase [Chloroflexota bacterium]|nr:FAD-dependent oxidoreductase [Chloroflexota bacterium]